MADRLAKKNNAVLWLQIHGIDAWNQPGKTTILGDGSKLKSGFQPGKKIKAYAVNKSIPRIDLVTSVSSYTKKRFSEWSGISTDKIIVLPNTVNQQFNWHKNKSEFKQNKGFNEVKILLTVGRLSKQEQYKGHDRIIKALAKIKQIPDAPKLLYLVAGDGRDQYRLMDLAEKLKIDEQVKFLGRVDDERLADLYRLADLFVMPSTGEGFGISFLEAMGCGTPALGFGVDGSRDPLMEGKLGIISSEENLAEDIIRAVALGPSEERAQQVNDHFGINAFQNKVNNLVDRIGQSLK